MVKIGDKIRITSDNETYNKWRWKTWTVSHIAMNREQHPGYDSGVGGSLIDCEGLPVSLYEYEYDIVSESPKKKNKGWREKADHTGKAPRHRIASISKELKSMGRHQTIKSPSDPTYSKEWSGVSYAPHAKGKHCPDCGENLHKEAGSFYCPKCDNYKRPSEGY